MYSDFYEIPLPALCFEKTRGNQYQRDDTKETTLPKENGTQKNDVKTRKGNDAHKLTDLSKDLINQIPISEQRY